MDLIKMNLWRGGIFKQLKFLVSSPQQAQKVYLISETGSVSQEQLGMRTGFAIADSVKKAWAVVHSLKFQVKRDGVALQEESALVISERSYIPLDPNNIIKAKDKEKLASLEDIASLRHDEAMVEAGRKQGTSTGIATLIINCSFALLALFGIIALLQGCGQ